MAAVGDLLARDRRSSATALRHAPSGREYDYRRFCTTAWKVGNFLRNEGVRTDARVVVADDPRPEAVLSFFGAALLGATVSFDGAAADAKALVGPADALDEFDVGPTTRLVAYGEAHADPSVAHFERDVWSENPTRPPDRVGSDTPLLAAAGRTVTHGNALAAARRLIDKHQLTDDVTVAVRAPFAEPGVVVAGLIAPVVAGGSVLFPGEDEVGDIAVGDGEAPEARVVAPTSVR